LSRATIVTALLPASPGTLGIAHVTSCVHTFLLRHGIINLVEH
jgi:hypothetical protein